MSRAYRLGIAISNLKSEEELAAREAAEDACYAWNEDWHAETQPDKTIKLTSVGEASLHGGNNEGEFADQVAQIIWRKLGRYVPVEVETICLEYLPVETHTRDENDYTLAKNSGLLTPEE
jgi:hypothetical protein